MFTHFPTILIHFGSTWKMATWQRCSTFERQKQHNIIHQQHWKRASLLNFDLVWSLRLCLPVSSWLCKPWEGQSVKALWLTVSGQHWSQRIDRHMCNERISYGIIPVHTSPIKLAASRRFLHAWEEALHADWMENPFCRLRPWCHGLMQFPIAVFA